MQLSNFTVLNKVERSSKSLKASFLVSSFSSHLVFYNPLQKQPSNPPVVERQGHPPSHQHEVSRMMNTLGRPKEERVLNKAKHSCQAVSMSPLQLRQIKQMLDSVLIDFLCIAATLCLSQGLHLICALFNFTQCAAETMCLLFHQINAMKPWSS